MNKNYFIWLLCIIIIVICFLLCYKIETYINLEQKTTADDIPKSYDDFSCYNYLKKIKNWDIDSYNSKEQKMLATLKTGFTRRTSDITMTSPYIDGCVIPKEHQSVFGIQGDCTVSKSPYSEHVLKKTDDFISPSGCLINFKSDYSDENKFRNLLNNMDNNFNAEYYNKIEELTRKRNELLNDNNKLKKDLENVNNNIQIIVPYITKIKREYDNLQKAIDDEKTKLDMRSILIQIYNNKTNTLNTKILSIQDNINYFKKIYTKYNSYML